MCKNERFGGNVTMIKGRIILEFDTTFKNLAETTKHQKTKELIESESDFLDIFDFIECDDTLDEFIYSFIDEIDNYSVEYYEVE